MYFSLIDRARLEHQAGNIRGWEWHVLKGLDHAELLTLRGHDGAWVNAVARSPDGKWIATGGGGNPFFNAGAREVAPGTVVVWDAATGRPMHTLRAHKYLVTHVDFSRDGRIVASSSLDGTVQLHEAATGRLVRTLVIGKAAVANDGSDHSRLLALTADGRRLATSSDERTMAVWDLAAGTRSPMLPARADDYYAKAAFTASWLAVATRHQGRRDEAKTWFDRADRFVRETVPDDRFYAPGVGSELDHLQPPVV